MCRNIKPLFNFAPPATEDEVRASALQFVRKVSGFTKPSKANEAAFELAVDEVTAVTRKLLESLVTDAEPKDRDVEAMKRKEKSLKRFAILATFLACASAPASAQHLPPQCRAETDGKALETGSHRFQANGVRFWYCIAGNETSMAAPVVFLHGGPGANSHVFAM